jgi:cysteine desulfurase
VDEFGCIDPLAVERAITSKTIFASIMHANNEVGTIQPIAEISAILKKRGILFHTDAAQSCGKIPVNVNDLSVDLLSVAGHKLYGPKGIGVLYIRRGVKLEKLMHGADHEMNLRAGTENVLEVVGLGKACEIAPRNSQQASGSTQEPKGVFSLRDILSSGILEQLPEVKRNGAIHNCLPNTLSLSFPGVDATVLLTSMKGIAASAGAACHSDRTDISAVLTAMGVPIHYAMGTIRFSLGRMTTEADIQKAIPIITESYKKLKGESINATSAQNSIVIKLTEYTHSLGCACKIRPQLLQEILKDIPLSTNPDVLIDLRNSDDAAVYRLDSNTAIVQTVDFIPPIVDDAYQYGAISAANSLSDIYAMGAEPLFALSVVAFPDKLLPLDILREIIRGATDKAAEAGISIIGGHTIEDTEPKFGLVVTGRVHPGKIFSNSGAKPGDAILLTKPIGTGIMSTGMKRGLVSKENERSTIAVMTQLNRTAAALLAGYPVSALTDVTGFGLLGHLKEMVVGSNVVAEIFSQQVPILEGVLELVTGNVIPGGTRNNLEFIADVVQWSSSVPESMKYILADAQTSGGLLIALPQDSALSLLGELHAAGVSDARIIGRMKQDSPGQEGGKQVIT